MQRSITGLDYPQQISADTLDLSNGGKITVNGKTPQIAGQFIGYDVASDSTKYLPLTQYVAGTGLTLTNAVISFSGGDLGGVDVIIRGSLFLASQANLVATGAVFFTNLPTSDPQYAGQLWNDNGTVKVSGK